MQKLPKTNRVNGWTLARKRDAFQALQLAKRRRRRQVPLVEEPFTLLDGLVAYWKLDEAEGEVRLDSSGNELHLTDNNAVGQSVGVIGSAADCAYNGADRWLDHEDHPLLRFDTDFTMSMWVFRMESFFGGDFILNKTGALYLYAHIDAEFRLVLDLIDDSPALLTSIVSDAIIEENEWFHVVLYRSGSTFGLIVNGGPPKTANIGGAVLSPNGVFRIGAMEAGYPFTGLIDEVGKWNRVLTSAEIAELYNSRAGLAFQEFS